MTITMTYDEHTRRSHNKATQQTTNVRNMYVLGRTPARAGVAHNNSNNKNNNTVQQVRTCWRASPRSRRPGSFAQCAARNPCADCANRGPFPRRCRDHVASAPAVRAIVPDDAVAPLHSGIALSRPGRASIENLRAQSWHILCKWNCQKCKIHPIIYS